MTTDIEMNKNEKQTTLSMHPKRMIMWLMIASIIMIFASLTSAYIVRQADGNWLEFDLPQIFWINTGIILLSSVTMHWAYLAAKRNKQTSLKIAITITSILGIAFLNGQFTAWDHLAAQDVFFEGNPSGSFLYVFTGVHAFHLITGVIFLLIVLILAFRGKVNTEKMLWVGICTTYWHFLDALWVYLFLFLLFFR